MKHTMKYFKVSYRVYQSDCQRSTFHPNFIYDWCDRCSGPQCHLRHMLLFCIQMFLSDYFNIIPWWSCLEYCHFPFPLFTYSGLRRSFGFYLSAGSKSHFMVVEIHYTQRPSVNKVWKIETHEWSFYCSRLRLTFQLFRIWSRPL